eukprot:6231549-Alexandrium_andersonii.AAC.1
MSASLVGSEMCIRDSLIARAFLRRGTPRTSARAHERTSAQAHERTSAVSYTHLTLPTICSV